MSITVRELESIAQLAYLEIKPNEVAKLSHEINAIMDFVQQLSTMDTASVQPLFHPLDTMVQPLRDDVVTEADCLAQLASIAPCFNDGFYIAPQVITSDSDKGK
jgi:aspartyl-tRNA(Asn)/glutamyl-tRNA(Gln) amidotransferase subunit C